MPFKKRLTQPAFYPILFTVLVLFPTPGLLLQSDDIKSTKHHSTQLDTERVESLIRALVEGDDETRIEAAETLGKSGDRRAVHPLIKALKDSKIEVRKKAALALGEIGDTQATESLIKALTDFSNNVREAAAEALGNIGDARAVVPLFIALGDEEAFVSQAAGNSLKKMGEPGGYFLYLGLKVSYDDAIEKVKSEATPRLYDNVLEAFEHWDIKTRERIVWILGSLQNERTIDFLKAIFSDPYSGVRAAAVWSLGRMDDKKNTDLLLQALEDSSFFVRKAAASSLGNTPDNSVVEPLINVLSDENPKVREAALWSLMKKGDKRVLGPAIKALEDSEINVRIPAAWILGEVGDASVVKPLIKALEDSAPKVREAAIWSLCKSSGQDAFSHIVKALEDKSSAVRVAAAQALGYIGDDRGIVPLMEAMADKDTEVQEAALSSAKKMNHPLANALSENLKGNRKALESIVVEGKHQQSDIFLKALNSRSAEIRRTAAWYLGKIKERRAIDNLIKMAAGWSFKDRFYGLSALSNLNIVDYYTNISLVLKIYLTLPSNIYFLIMIVPFGLIALSIPVKNRKRYFTNSIVIGCLVSGILISLPALSFSRTYFLFLLIGILPFLCTVLFFLLLRQVIAHAN